MADYCTLEEVYAELIKQGNGAADKDAIMERLPRASRLVDELCGYHFDGPRRAFDYEVVTNEIRRGEHVQINHDGDLLVSVAKGYCQSLSAAAYSTDRKTWITLDTSAVDIDRYVLTFIDPAVAAARGTRLFVRLSYTGGYSVLPESLVHAATRYCAFLYHKREAPFEVTAFPDVGQISIPSSVPGDVAQMLTPFKRVRP